MKKFASCFMAVMILVLYVCSLPVAAASPAISLSTSAYQVNPGDVITVSVGLSADSGLGTLNFNVSYNTSELEYVAGSAAATDLFGMPIVNDTVAGSIKYVGADSGSVTAGGSLVSMKFKVLKAGGTITVTVVKATDANDSNVAISGKSIKLSCAHGNMKWTVDKKATCTAEGSESGTCSCGYTETRTIEKADHKYTDPVIVKKATCTEDGIMRGTCVVCKEAGVETKIEKTGHKWTDWVVTTKPTIITKGEQERTCLNCGEKQTKVISSISQEEPSSQEPSSSEELSTEPSSLFEEFEVPSSKPTQNYYEIETEPTTEPSGGLFGFADFSESDMAALLVIVLAVLVVIVLVVYILLIRQRKR